MAHQNQLIAVIRMLIARGKFSVDNGETWFQGESLSALIAELRDRGYSISRPHDFEDRLKQLGFSIIKARQFMPWRGNPKACRAPCTCVTLRTEEPSLSPFEAKEALYANKYEDIQHADSFLYQLDGPQGCPLEAMSPFAYRGEWCWYPPGESSDEITKETKWVKMKF